MPPRHVLLTGATGYIGGRLLPALEARGWRVRCLCRNPAALAHRVAFSTEIAAGDCLDEASLARAFEGVEVAYYLVHSMAASADFEDTDRRAASTFARAAAAAGVRRIVYLGGLGESAAGLSAHLKSRQETGALLGAAGVDVIELRASIVIGAGSLSFEMIRALVERLPVMVCPRWVAVQAQPVGIDDVVEYLAQAGEARELPPGIYEIGGPDVVSYGDIMREYARQRGLRRLLVPIPLLTPYLSSLWLGLVTPLYSRVGRLLIEGMRNQTIVRHPEPASRMEVRPRGLREAVTAAIADRSRNVERLLAELPGRDPAANLRALRDYGCLLDSREASVDAAPAAAFEPIRRIGGETGWYYGNALWRLRGWMDRMAGGVGMRPGRPASGDLPIGSALDFWRVVFFEPGRRLTLSAEMKLPGRAWLQFDVTPAGAGGARIQQTALFDPRGLAGHLYWWALLPAHAVIFSGMLREIAKRAGDARSTSAS